MGQRIDRPFPFKIDQRRGRREDIETVSHLSRAIGFDHHSLVFSDKERAKCKMKGEKLDKIGKRVVWALANLRVYDGEVVYIPKESLLYTRASRPR
jgi:hypothetical protein